MKYVNTLLEVYTKFSDVVKTAFENDPAFVAALDKVGTSLFLLATDYCFCAI